MPWIKSKLSTKWHSKLKHYRDKTECDTLSEAVAALIQRGLLSYESEHGTLPEEYNKKDKPTWDHESRQ